MAGSEFHEAWQKPQHAETFDTWAHLSLAELRKTYESFNEIRLFVQNLPFIQKSDFAEIGCATGELYRYLNRYHPRFTYYGFDISEEAIRRAREKFPGGQFFVCDEILSSVKNRRRSPAVLLSRDVIHHQPSPFAFMSQLIAIPEEAAILRIRTRDRGETVLDPELSCQRTYQNWVPYMVLNVDEVIETVKKTRPFNLLHIRKHYQILGGRHNRYLPKACYETETGTAETALYIHFGSEGGKNSEIVIDDRIDSRPQFGFLEKITGRFRKWIP